MEDRIAWELRSYNAYAYYAEELGEFEKPLPPKFEELKHAWSILRLFFFLSYLELVKEKNCYLSL